MNPFYLSILFHILLMRFASSQNTQPSYQYTDLTLISCGSTGNHTYNGREWVSDTGSEFVDMKHISFPSTPSTIETSVSEIPYYNNASIFLSNFTYSIPVSAAGPMFLRLYFYPVTYSGHPDISTSFFSVVANGYTLMTIFSPDLALTPENDYFSKEFIVSSGEGKELKVTFSPNLNSYGFVNAIEVVSMPTDLYYDRDCKNVSSDTIPMSMSSLLSNTTSLETVLRLNVGGLDVSPKNDTGMFRTWTQDQYFITNFKFSNVYGWPPEGLSLEFNDKNTPNYTAPELVYGTSRLLGGEYNENLRYNLTWKLTVDPGFYYLVRLHFCETRTAITRPHQVVFTVYINNQTAEPILDVFDEVGHSVPMHRDYVVLVSSADREPRTDLFIALHPFTDTIFHPQYNDVLLNGAEIFKMSGPDRSLAGLNPNPRPSTIIPASPAPARPPRRTHVPIFAGVSGGVLGLVFLSVLLCFLVFRRSRKNYLDSHSGYKKGTTSWDPFSTSSATTKSTKSRGGSSLPSDLCRHFTIAEIKSATNNFDHTFVIGAGGFGNVYKGTIDTDTGPTPVAIKRLNPGSKQGLHEFLTEIELLTRLRHLHLVSLIGFCEDDNEMILVYDYMSRGTLRDHLYNTQNPTLPWIQRLEICIGAARGLQYLHTGAKHTIIHRDVKTTNILIDEKYVAKVSDFGLSRIGSTSVTKAHVTTVVKGSFGYLDPEYFKRQQLTEKSDVYSFGVVLCEVISAKPPLNVTAEKRRVNLAELARECYRRGTFESLVDAKLKGKIALESLNKYVEIAIKCLGDNGSERPSMGDVVWGLEFVLELQKTADKRASGEEEKEVESDDLWDESVTASTEVTTVVGSSISGERMSMN